MTSTKSENPNFQTPNQAFFEWENPDFHNIPLPTFTKSKNQQANAGLTRNAGFLSSFLRPREDQQPMGRRPTWKSQEPKQCPGRNTLKPISQGSCKKLRLRCLSKKVWIPPLETKLVFLEQRKWPSGPVVLPPHSPVPLEMRLKCAPASAAHLASHGCHPLEGDLTSFGTQSKYDIEVI